MAYTVTASTPTAMPLAGRKFPLIMNWGNRQASRNDEDRAKVAQGMHCGTQSGLWWESGKSGCVEHKCIPELQYLLKIP